MNWHEVPWWLPSATVAALAVLAVVAVAAQPPRWQRRYWLAAVLLAGLLAIAGSVRQQARSRANLAGETRRLHALVAQLDALGRLLPAAAPDAAPGDAFATVTSGIAALKARITKLEGQLRELRERSRGRTIAAERATRMADELRRAGAHRVVVSCPPDDAEAFAYANQLANVLRTAGWEAPGPEKTTIHGDTAAMGIKLYVRGGAKVPEAAKALTEAFTRFNIPYQGGITPNKAIPDPATVELFVGPKP